MARPPIPIGTIGKIQVLLHPDGRYRARARARDDAGTLHQAKVIGTTADEARHNLRQHFAKQGIAGYVSLDAKSTIADACASWLKSVRRRAQFGSITYSTVDSYESTARLTIVPRCGEITLDALTVGRCDRIIQSIAVEQSLSTARRARSVLSLVIGHAVRDDAIPSNPMRYIQRLPQPPKKTSILTPDQVHQIRILMARWRENGSAGPRPNAAALVDGMDVMLGTSARIGECLAIRRCDVDLTTDPPTVSINGTIVQNREKGTYRKDTPKQARQVRRVALPPTAAQAMRRQLNLAGGSAAALLFSTSTGIPMSVSNYERLHRSFVDDHHNDLIQLGINVEEFSTHIYRRTIATWIERSVGINLASRLLGHANEQVTRANYIVTAEKVDPVSAEVLATILGE